MNTLITFALSVVFVVSCAPSTKVEIEPGESLELIIVEPKTETFWRSGVGNAPMRVTRGEFATYSDEDKLETEEEVLQNLDKLRKNKLYKGK